MAFSEQRRVKVYEKFLGKCAYCGEEILFKNFHIDHVNPKFYGGKSKIENLNPSCQECNLSKNSLDVEQFRIKIQNMINKTNDGKMIKKYYDLKPKKISFFYEEVV